MNKFSSILRITTLGVAALLVSACSSTKECPLMKKSAKAQTCSATGFSMAGKHTYKWVTPKNGISDSDLHNNAFWRAEAKSAVDADLAKKGYTKVTSGKADFLVGASGMKRQAGALVVASSTTGYKKAPGLCGNCEMKPLAEGEAVACLEIIDPSSKLIVWCSGVRTELLDKATPAQRGKHLQAIAAEALKSLPAAK